jgi:hypothetical protein
MAVIRTINNERLMAVVEGLSTLRELKHLHLGHLEPICLLSFILLARDGLSLTLKRAIEKMKKEHWPQMKRIDWH